MPYGPFGVFAESMRRLAAPLTKVSFIGTILGPRRCTKVLPPQVVADGISQSIQICR